MHSCDKEGKTNIVMANQIVTIYQKPIHFQSRKMLLIRENILQFDPSNTYFTVLFWYQQ